MKLMTRSIHIHEGADWAAEIGRSFIEAYIQAAREMPMPWLTHVEKRQEHLDVQFVLTFESIQVMRTERTADAIQYMFGVPTSE